MPGEPTVEAAAAPHVRLEPQPAWVRFQDIIVRLDSGELVAVNIETVAELRGDTFVHAQARQVDAAGQPVRDAQNVPMGTRVNAPYSMETLQAAGLRVVDFQRDCVRLVLGEPTRKFFLGDEDAALRQRSSLRARIAAAAAGIPVADGADALQAWEAAVGACPVK